MRAAENGTPLRAAPPRPENRRSSRAPVARGTIEGARGARYAALAIAGAGAGERVRLRAGGGGRSTCAAPPSPPRGAFGAIGAGSSSGDGRPSDSGCESGAGG